MSVNSAEPERLIGYVRAVLPPTREGRVALDSCSAAALTHNRRNPGFPVDLSPITHARSVLAETERSLARTAVVAEAFVAADRSGATLRTTDDRTLLRHVADIAAERFGGPEPDSPDAEPTDRGRVFGFFREGEHPIRIGSHEIDTAGDILLGAAWEGGFRGPRIEDGSLIVGGSGEGFVGARTRGHATTDLGPATVDLDGELAAGATIELDGSASVGRDGLDVSAGLDASLAVRAEAEGTVDLGPASASGGCEAALGAGLTAHQSTRVSWDEIHMEGALGLIWGAGGACGASVSVSPRELAEDLGRAGRHLWDHAEPAAGAVVDAAGDLWDGAWNIGEGAVHLGGSAIGSVLSWRP